MLMDPAQLSLIKQIDPHAAATAFVVRSADDINTHINGQLRSQVRRWDIEDIYESPWPAASGVEKSSSLPLLGFEQQIVNK